MPSIHDLLNDVLTKALHKASLRIKQLEDRIAELEGRPTSTQRQTAAFKAMSDGGKRAQASRRRKLATQRQAKANGVSTHA